MLESLTIRRIALIDEATIRFHDGMQVLTGETGAGKSIVVDSVNLILGGRADRELIRSGCENASVEAVFRTSGNASMQAFMSASVISQKGFITALPSASLTSPQASRQHAPELMRCINPSASFACPSIS